MKNFFGDAGHRSSYLSHAKRALYHLSYILVMISLRASFWTQFMKNWLSICNELSIPSHYQQIQPRIIESSKCFGDAGHRSPYLSHAKRALYHLSYIPVLLKLRASFEQNSWNISFPFVTSCQFIPIISKYKPELSNPQKCFGDAGHRSPYLSHAKRALYHLSYIPVLLKLRASSEQNSWNISFPFVTSCQFLPISTNKKNRIVAS